jgi:uncharacterized membrane protein (UPF0182 family)
MPEPGRGRRLVLVLGIAVVAVLIALTALSGFFVDVLWFREVGFSDVFWTILRAKFLLGLVFGLVFFALLYSNLLIVRIVTPRFRALTPDQEVIERYRLAFEPYAWWLLPLMAGVIAAFVGFGVTTEWRTFLLWRNSAGVAFGTTDPLFGRDPAFYVFSLPWLEFLQGWLFSSLVGVTFITAVAHYVWGGIQPQAQGFGEKVTPQVKAHLSVLLGLIVLTKAWGYYLGRFDLLTSQRGVVEGASYTDVTAQLPALKILVFIAVVCAVLFLVNIRLRGWALPVIAVGLLALASVAAGAAYPAFVQRFRVAPQELQRERPYIKRNILATQAAFNLDPAHVTSTPRSVAAVTPADIRDNEATISNIRLWRPDTLKRAFDSLQRIRSYYEFSDVDVDRYSLANGDRRVLMVAAREVVQDGIPGGGATWQNKHLVYTHGFGAVAAQVNSATSEGAPAFTLSDIPPQGEPSLAEQPRIYFGEATERVAPFVVVDTGTRELDYVNPQNDQEQKTTRYSGSGGIRIGGLLPRALFAWYFRDVNLLISGLIHSDSKILIHQSIADRVPRAAPFLQFDDDPYSAIVDGRLVWVWDAYTTTTRYPYSQATDLGATSTGNTLTGTANYIRNSVKVVVDAYNGTMHYYVSDPSDPIIEAWRNAFPTLFSPMSAAPPEIQAHFRYPENLFEVQAAQWTNYHVEDPTVFYQKQDFWQIPLDPTSKANAESAGRAVFSEEPMRPYYVLMRLPGETDETFALIMPFTPQGRQNMVGWMAARSDIGAGYGQLVSYEFPSGQNVDGPSQVFSRIQQDPTWSQQQSLLSQGNSRVFYGDFLVVPVSDGLLYVEPVYVQSQQENPIPELKRVLVVTGGTVGLGSNLQDALSAALGGRVSPGGGQGGGQNRPPVGTVDQRIAEFLAQAQQHFQAANEALKAGDLARYQAEINAAERAIAQANDLAAGATAGGGGNAPATATPSPTG